MATLTKPDFLTKFLALFADNEYQNITEATFRDLLQDAADSFVAEAGRRGVLVSFEPVYAYRKYDVFKFTLPGGQRRLFEVRADLNLDVNPEPTGADDDPYYAPLAPLSGGSNGPPTLYNDQSPEYVAGTDGSIDPATNDWTLALPGGVGAVIVSYQSGSANRILSAKGGAAGPADFLFTPGDSASQLVIYAPVASGDRALVELFFGSVTAADSAAHAALQGQLNTLGAQLEQVRRLVSTSPAVSGATYTLQASDGGNIVPVTYVNPVAITLPAGVLPLNAVLEIAQLGTGRVSLVAGSGVNIHPADKLRTAEQYSSVGLWQYAPNKWMISNSTS